MKDDCWFAWWQGVAAGVFVTILVLSLAYIAGVWLDY